MDVFYKKNTLIRSITFMAIIAAINVILSLIGALVPFASVILIIFMPLTSAIVEVACEDKYFPIYALGTIGLSLVATFWNFDFTIFYLIPSIITGYIFGLMTKKKIQPIWTVLTATVAQTIISFIFVPLIELLTGRNIINDIISILMLGNLDLSDYILSLFFAVSLIQIILCFIVTNYELKKFSIEGQKINSFDNKIAYIIFGVILLAVATSFLYVNVSNLLVLIAFYFTYFVISKTINDHDFRKIIIFGIVIFLNIFFYALMNPIVETKFLLLLFSPLFIGVFYILKIK